MFHYGDVRPNLDDQGDERRLPDQSVWQQELVDREAVSPVEVARARFFDRDWDHFLHHNSYDIENVTPRFPWAFRHRHAVSALGPPTGSGTFLKAIARAYLTVPDSTDHPDQLSFLLDGAFTPSSRLTDIWVRGLKALAKEANVKSTGLALSSTPVEIQQEFTKMIISLFATIGQQLRYQATPNLVITENGRFMLPYQIIICDRFFVIPDEAATFLRTLREDLVYSLSKSASLKGSWGQVSLTPAHDLVYALKPPPIIRDPGFIPAEDVE